MCRSALSVRSAGFSLIELIGVLVVLSALSAAALPTLERIERSRRTGLAVEIERRLTLARAAAMATGEPHGVRIASEEQILSTVRIEESGAEPSPAIGMNGDAAGALEIPASYPGAAIESMVNGDGDSRLDTIWFGYDGSPHLREEDGARIGPFTVDAVISVVDGPTIEVRRLTGLVERGT